MNDVFIIALVCLIHVFAFIIGLSITTVDDESAIFIHVDIRLISDDLQTIPSASFVFMFEIHFDDLNQQFNPLLHHTNYFLMQQTIYP